MRNSRILVIYSIGFLATLMEANYVLNYISTGAPQGQCGVRAKNAMAGTIIIYCPWVLLCNGVDGAVQTLESKSENSLESVVFIQVHRTYI